MSKRITLFQALAATISSLTLMLRDVEPEIFGRKITADSWSLVGVLNHLIFVEQHYYPRLRRVLAEERPSLPRILPDPTTHNLQASPTELLAQFRAARQATLAFLRDVADDEWGRTAVHETQGEVTFHFLVQYLVDHDGEHLNQIAAIQKQLNVLPDRQAQPAISEKTARANAYHDE